MRLLKRKPQSFDLHVQDMVLRVKASPDLFEESRAAALSFWEQLHAYALQHPEFSDSLRPIDVPENAPDVIREMVQSAASAGVGPRFTFQGAVLDHVGRYLARSAGDVTVSAGGDFFITTKKRMKLTVHRTEDGEPLSVVVDPASGGIGVATALVRGAADGVDGLAVLASSCKLAEAAASAVRSILANPGSFKAALEYLGKVHGVRGGLLV